MRRLPIKSQGRAILTDTIKIGKWICPLLQTNAPGDGPGAMLTAKALCGPNPSPDNATCDFAFCQGNKAA
ncbi:MAG TPA: hypothetical protein DCL95_15910 [Rhodospirillaceae bacterium]|nr:hypothetical protein [Rhodospirillaceae bacterium]